METHLTQTARALNPSIPKGFLSHSLWLPDETRSMGIHILAGKGSGKSRLMGRLIAWLDFVRGIPLVIFDPHGPTIDNFLDKLTRLPRGLQERLWPRVQYVDMSGKSGSVIPFPLYYRLGNESLYEISQRFLDVVRKIDPFLPIAPIEGWNQVWRTGTYTGLILAGLGYQISEVESLFRTPSAWAGEFQRVLSLYPEALPAVEFFRELAFADERLRTRRTESFFTKTAYFLLDPSQKAMFGAKQPGIHWPQVMEQGTVVLLDFRHEHDLESRRFKMVWALNYFLDFIKRRGAGRFPPVSLIVDELTALLSPHVMGTDLLAADLDELINVLGRNYRVWLTLAHQELFQVNEKIQKTLMAMGTQILGSTSDLDAALTLAQRFFPYDPTWVRKYEPVYMALSGSVHIVDYRSVEFTMDEQAQVRSKAFTDQKRLRFWVRPAPREGETTGKVWPITITNFDKDRYTDEALVAQARELLMARRGWKVSDVLAEIEARRPARLASASVIAEFEPPRPKAAVRRRKLEQSDDDEFIFGEKATAAQTETRRG